MRTVRRPGSRTPPSPGRPERPPETPFDTAARGYDEAFTHRTLARRLREAVWREVDPLVAPGDEMLEVGCGTGEDALHLARRGVRVTATDASTRMLEVAQRKVAAAGLGHRVRFARWDLSVLGAGPEPVAGAGPGSVPAAGLELVPGAPPESMLGTADAGTRDGPFDGALANFGVLNCVAHRRPVAGVLGRRLRPGARLVLVVMGPLCPWEVVWHLARFEPGMALRRLRPGCEARVGEPPRPVRVWYPTPRKVRAEFAPWFRCRGIRGIGVVLPPPYLDRLVAGRPRLLARLARLDRRLGRRWPGTWLNDHYLLVLERR